MTRYVPQGDSPAMRRLLHALEKKPNMSASDLSAEAFVGVSTLACGGYLKALKSKGLIYVSGWRQLRGRFTTPLYSVGDLSDVERPAVDDSNRDAPGMWRILGTLEVYGPLTYGEIALYSGLSRNTVKNSGYLRALSAQHKIHICGWKRAVSGPMQAIYRAGDGDCVPRPEAFSGAEKNVRYRQRQSISKSAASRWPFSFSGVNRL